MKKIISLILVAAMLAVSLSACSLLPDDFSLSDIFGFIQNLDTDDTDTDEPDTDAPDTDPVGTETHAPDTDTPDTDKPAEPAFKLNVTETDTQFIWEIAGNTFIVITHDGTNVTACDTYLDLGSEEEAKSTADALRPIVVMEGSAVKDLYAKGTYLVYIYNEDAFIFHTYEEAKTAFDAAAQMAQ